jgi:hypothetical protein
MCPVLCEEPYRYCCKRRGGHDGYHQATGPGMFTQWDDDRKIVSRKKEPFKRKKRVMKITFKETAEPGTKFLQDVEPGQTFVYNSFVYQKARVNERALLINNISSNQNVVQQLVIEIRTGLITTMAHNVPVRLVEAEVVVHRFI